MGTGAYQRDHPLLTAGFSTGDTLIVCGSLIRKLDRGTIEASEFEILNCSNGQILFSCDALDSRELSAKSDTLEIGQYVSLPSAVDWKYQKHLFRRQLVLRQSNSITLAALVFAFKAPRLKQKQIHDALAFSDSIHSVLFNDPSQF